MFSLEEEHAGQKHKEGGAKLNHAVGQGVAATGLKALLGLSFLKKLLRIFHVPLHTALGLHLLNQCRVSDLLNADGVIILVASNLSSGGAAGLIFQKVSPIHAGTHEVIISLCSDRRVVDIITAIVFLIGGAGAIAAVHVVVVGVLLFGVAEIEMRSREAPKSISNGHSSHSPDTCCHHGFFGKTC